MFKSLKKIFKSSEQFSKDIADNEELNLFCGLMIEAAQSDGSVDKNEIDKISKILVDFFHEDSSEVDIILKKCLKEVNEPKSLHAFTSKINKIFNDQKKILLIETLWEIVLSDGKIHDFESNLIRRLAGLLYISDVNCGNAKKRALVKLNKVEEA